MHSVCVGTSWVLARIMLVGLATLWLAGTVAAAPPPNRPLNDPTGDSQVATQSNPVVRSLGDKVVAMWSDFDTGTTGLQRIQYAVSVDSGSTFADMGPLPLPPTTSVSWRWNNDPQLALDPRTGSFYAAGQISSTGSPTPHIGVAVVRGTFVGSALVWDAPIVVRDFPSASFVRFPSLAFDVELPGLVGAAGDLHLLYCNYTVSPPTLEHQKSADQGMTWSSPIDISTNGQPVRCPRLASGVLGDMYAAWLEGGTGPYASLRFRRWGGFFWELTTATPAVGVFNPLAPGQQGVNGGFGVAQHLSLAVNQTPGSNTYGQPAIAWSESWDYGDDAFIPFLSSPWVVEVENNDFASRARSFVLGDVLIGASSKSTDRDWWKVSLAAGQSMLALPDSVAQGTGGGPGFELAVLAPDTTTQVGSVIAGRTAFAYRAPVAGTYYLRATLPDGTPNYHVRTRTSSVGAGESRDHRDVAVVYRPAGTWTAPIRLAYSASGYDDHLPEIAYGADGLDYLTWYDFGILATGAHSHLVVARNITGVDPVRSPPQIVTTAPSRWDSVSFLAGPGSGNSNSVFADSRRVHLGWTDLRTANIDVMATTLSTGLVVGACPASASGAPGSTVPLQLPLTNRNELFEEKSLIHVTGSRGWPVIDVRDSVPAAAAGTLDFAVAIPDSAAPGVNTLSITVRRQSGLAVTSCSVPLTITNATGVEDVGTIAFAMHSPAPNPTRGRVSLDWVLPTAGTARLEILGIRGEHVRTLLDGPISAGHGSLVWNACDDQGRRVAAGVYFVRFASEGRVATRRMLVLK